MPERTFFAIDSEALTVLSSTTQAVGASIINNSDSPDGTTYVFNAGFSSVEITVDDTAGDVDTLDDDAAGGHTIIDGAGIVADGNGIEAESTILLQALDELGSPTGPVITVTVFSQNGVTGDVWGFGADQPLIPGTEYVKVGGDNIGDVQYVDIEDPLVISVDGTDGDDAMGIGFTDAQGDQIDGADGDDDFIFGNGGNDTINAGAGNDFVDGGDDADRILVTDGFGSDTIIGGEGGTDDDAIDFSGLTGNVTVTITDDEAGTATDGTDTLSFSEIEDIFLSNEADLLDATADTAGVNIFAGGEADTLLGGSGDDFLRGQSGTDSLLGGLGSDTLTGNRGSDTIDGGEGGDSISGDGGADFIIVDQGDTVTGGGGDDFFQLVDLDNTGTGAITIVGGENGENNGDTLQLTSDVSQNDITFTNTDDAAGGLSGTFTLPDGTVVTFSEIENIICFTPGTLILTEQGERPVESLRPGDRVITRDNGIQPIRWIGKRTVPGIDRFAPIELAPGVARGARRPILVSPQHRMLYMGYQAQLLFGESEVLVAAKHMVDGVSVRQLDMAQVTYIHLMFDQHEIIYAEGAATESFYAGDTALSAVSDESREELFALFPELRSNPGEHLRPARPCLKRHEACLLSELSRPARQLPLVA